MSDMGKSGLYVTEEQKHIEDLYDSFCCDTSNEKYQNKFFFTLSFYSMKFIFYFRFFWPFLMIVCNEMGLNTFIEIYF